jgi:hypothetical protein
MAANESRQTPIRIKRWTVLLHPQMYLNKARNWLKHWQGMKDEEKIEIELETEAIQYIVRAVTNLAGYDKSCTSETPRFF